MRLRVFPVAALWVLLALSSGGAVSSETNKPIRVLIVNGTAVGRPSKSGAKVFPWTSADSAFRTALEQTAGSNCRTIAFFWDGANTHEARVRAGQELAGVIKSIHGESEARFFVVGHSHGGNVALLAVNNLPPKAIEGVFLLGTPSVRVVSEEATACPIAFELGEGAGDGCGGEHEHWLYWGQAPLRVSSPIWNLYSPQDSVQAVLVSVMPGVPLTGTPFSVVTAHNSYGGPYKDKVRSLLINWKWSPEDEPSFAKAAKLGIVAHSAMHSSAVGRLIGASIAGQTDPSALLREAALSSDANTILDLGK